MYLFVAYAFLKLGTKRNTSQVRLRECWDLWSFLSCGAPGRAEGARIWEGEPANELRKARTKAQRDDLTSGTKLQAGPLGGCRGLVPAFVITA